MSNNDHTPITDPPPQEKKEQESNPPPAEQNCSGAGYAAQGKSAPQFVQKPFGDSNPRQSGFVDRCFDTLCCCCSNESCF